MKSDAGVVHTRGESGIQWFAPIWLASEGPHGFCNVGECSAISPQDLDKGDLAIPRRGRFLKPLDEVRVIPVHGIVRAAPDKIKRKGPATHGLRQLQLCGGAALQIKSFVLDGHTLLRIQD